MKKWALVILAISLATVAVAGSKSATMHVSAKLATTVVVSTTNLDFGTWKYCDTDRKATATVSVVIPAGKAFAITMDAGLHFAGGQLRNVQNATFRVPYKILDPSGRALWGDKGYANTFTSGNPVRGTGTGKVQTFKANGVLQTKNVTRCYAVGLYTDSVTVTVYY